MRELLRLVVLPSRTSILSQSLSPWLSSSSFRSSSRRNYRELEVEIKETKSWWHPRLALFILLFFQFPIDFMTFLLNACNDLSIVYLLAGENCISIFFPSIDSRSTLINSSNILLRFVSLTFRFWPRIWHGIISLFLYSLYSCTYITQTLIVVWKFFSHDHKTTTTNTTRQSMPLPPAACVYVCMCVCPCVYWDSS